MYALYCNKKKNENWNSKLFYTIINLIVLSYYYLIVNPMAISLNFKIYQLLSIDNYVYFLEISKSSKPDFSEITSMFIPNAIFLKIFYLKFMTM